MKFKNLFGFGKLTALGFTQEDAQGHETSGSISVAIPSTWYTFRTTSPSISTRIHEYTNMNKNTGVRPSTVLLVSFFGRHFCHRLTIFFLSSLVGSSHIG